MVASKSVTLFINVINMLELTFYTQCMLTFAPIWLSNHLQWICLILVHELDSNTELPLKKLGVPIHEEFPANWVELWKRVQYSFAWWRTSMAIKGIQMLQVRIEYVAFPVIFRRLFPGLMSTIFLCFYLLLVNNIDVNITFKQSGIRDASYTKDSMSIFKQK